MEEIGEGKLKTEYNTWKIFSMKKLETEKKEIITLKGLETHILKCTFPKQKHTTICWSNY